MNNLKSFLLSVFNNFINTIWCVILKAPDIFLSLMIYILTTTLLIFLTSGCTGQADVEMTPLIAESVETPASVNDGGTSLPDTNPIDNPAKPENPPSDPSPDKSLFGLNPGETVALSSLGFVDPVGTALTQDFDGDGLTNSAESLGNYWVADYPIIETSIAPPVTMKIEILSTSGSVSSEITSNISSSDIETRRSQGSEKFHQSELAKRTIKTGSTTSGSSQSATNGTAQSNTSGSSQSTTNGTSSSTTDGSSSTNSTNSSFNTGASGGVPGVASLSIGFSTGSSSSNTATNSSTNSTNNSTTDSTNNSSTDSSTSSNSNSNSNSTTMDTYANRPFVNNLDRDAKSLNSMAAQNNARQFRAEKQKKVNSGTTIGSNAGLIRAALYIKNTTVNMPVKLSNILCSLLFESSEGELIPIQSFRLRNQDYSIFTVDVYGNSEFGPYVIELSGLNTVEIEKAIAKGYTPKIFIVDYVMNHVADSNYKSALSNSFNGDNLRIIEENAKGRTSLIKILGPYIRQMYRVAAFDINPTPSNLCDPAFISSSGTVSPGVTMKKALKRIVCSGGSVKFGHYVIDYTGTALEDPQHPMIYTEIIQSINGVSNNIPCTPHSPGGLTVIPGWDFNNNAVEACYVRLVDISEEQFSKLGLWSIFSRGRYFKDKDFARNSAGELRWFDSSQTIPMFQGVNSIIWAGDNYDIAYLSMADILNRKQDFGLNPLETYTLFGLNTRWNEKSLGLNPYYPDTKSVYLGKAALGEKVELEINLNSTWNLNPSFGEPYVIGNYSIYDNFTYNWQKVTNRLFLPGEAMDFEVNLGSGGTKSDWYNIIRTRGNPGGLEDSNQILNYCGISYNYLTQVFKICIQMPDPIYDGQLIADRLPNVGVDQMVDIYLRTTPNAAYREAIWPETYTNVKRFKGNLSEDVNIGESILSISNYSGILGLDVAEAGNSLTIGQSSYRISSILTDNSYYKIFLTTALQENHYRSEPVFIDSGLTEQNTFISMKNDAFSDWNNNYASVGSGIPNDGSQIYTSNLSNCLNGLDLLQNFSLSPKCQGINFPTLYANIAGGRSALSNDWADPGKLNKPFFHFNEGIEMAAIQKDFLPANPEQSMNINSRIVINSAHTRALIVWTRESAKGFDIRGRLVDLISKHPIGTDDFIISTSNAGNQMSPQVAVNGNTAFVVWESTSNGSLESSIRGRLIDMQTGNFVGEGNTTGGPDFPISALIKKNSNPRVIINSEGNTAFVLWEAYNTSYYSIQGRFVNLATGIPIGIQETSVDMNSAITGLPLIQVSISGNTGVAVWQGISSGGNGSFLYHTRARIIDLGTLSLGNMINASDVFSTTPVNPSIAVNGSKAFVAWSCSQDICGRNIDLSTGQALDRQFVVSSSNTNQQDLPAIAIYPDKALVVWQSNDDGISSEIRGRFIDLNTNAPIGIGDFLINTVTSNTQNNPVISMAGTRALVVWQSKDNGLDYDIHGRFVDMNTGNCMEKSDFLISTSNKYEQNHPAVYLGENMAFAVWSSYDSGINYNIRASFITPNFGPNNFFISPLLERNYSVRARILY